MQHATSIGFLSVHPHKDPHNAPDNHLAWTYKTIQMSSLEDVAQVMISRAWASCLWRDGHVKNENFIEAWGVVMDIDKDTSLRFAEKMLESVDHVTVTTRRHQSEETPWDRFRIYLPTWEPIRSANDYKATTMPLKIALKADDKSTSVGHRWRPGKEIYAIHQTGRRIAIEHYREPRRKKYSVTYPSGQYISMAEKIINETAPGRRNSDTFVAANRLKDGGLLPDEAFAFIKARINLPKHEIESIVRSVYGK